MSAEKSNLDAIKEWVAKNRAEQPSLGAEMRAIWRGGREDFYNNALFPGVNLTREPGSPGSPTPQIVTQDLLNREVDPERDQIQEREHDRGGRQ